MDRLFDEKEFVNTPKGVGKICSYVPTIYKKKL